MTHELIRDLRQKRGLTQQEVAEKVGISRTSYHDFEKGEKGLSLVEASNLADLFGISLEEVESGEKADYEKYKEMILYFVQKIKTGVTKTKLAKLLYLADFAWFYENYESMSGMDYKKNKYGPVPDIYFRALEEMGDFDQGEALLTCKEYEFKDGKGCSIELAQGSNSKVFSKLSDKEMILMDDIVRKWKYAKTNEIVSFTHNQLPYLLCDDEEIIPYGLIIQEDPNHVY